MFRLPSLRRAASGPPRASLAVKESATGIEFPLVTKLWQGEEMRCLGAGARVKKFAFVGVKVYAIALYVEAEKAARELSVRERGGFFETDDDYAQALIDGGFLRALAIELARDVTGKQFSDALEEALVPRLRITGDTGSLAALTSFFADKSLSKGTTVYMLYCGDGSLDMLVRKGTSDDLTTAIPSITIPSPGLTRAIFEIYSGSSPVVPVARTAWVAGAKQLLESERVKRDTRKGGSG